jgi:hypothetical protein
MKCQNFEEIVNDLSRARISDQGMETSLSERALAHADECAECALRLQDERALSRCLDEMAREMRSWTAPASVEAELLKVFRQSQRTEVGGQRSVSGGQSAGITGRWNRWVLAAAAVLLIVLGIGGLRRFVASRQLPGTGGSEHAIAETSPKPAPSTVEVGPGKSPAKPDNELGGGPGSIVSRTNTHPRRRPFYRDSNSGRQALATGTNPIANDSESEVATQFMPLDFAGPINLQDGGQLVRVDLPRSAMLNLGLPVNMDRYSERVKADVLVGADGLARAIRFVQ